MFTRIAVAISIFCLVFPAAAPAQRFAQGDKEVLLNGAGVSDSDFDSTIFSIQGSLGYFLTDHIEAAVRQSVAFTSVEGGGSSWNAATRGALDYNFDMGRFWPFVGASLGYIYGDDVSDTWAAGLEGGLKFFVSDTAFLLGMLQWEWFFNDDNNDGGFDDGQWVYMVGIGFRWQ
jgi:hypothetical protein